MYSEVQNEFKSRYLNAITRLAPVPEGEICPFLVFLLH